MFCRILKYGKGYIMTETTCLMRKFPFPNPDAPPDDDPWWFIFRPDTTKEVVIIDLACNMESKLDYNGTG